MINKKNISNDSKNVSSLILKVTELAKRGVDGERLAAIKKLNELCLKYGVEITDNIGFDKKVRTFKYTNTESKIILSHCIWDVVSDADIRNDSSLKNLYTTLDVAEYIQVKEKYKYYHKNYKEECKTFLTAFILKNNIGVKIDPDNFNNNEDVVKIKIMMGLVKNAPFEKVKTQQ